MTSAAESQNVAIILFVTAAVAGMILLARSLIRARFGRNMPMPRFAGANRNPPPPCVPIQRPLLAECPVHGELPNGGPRRACLADEMEKVAAERERRDAEQLRAYKLHQIAERLFVAHPQNDPEQVYRDAVR